MSLTSTAAHLAGYPAGTSGLILTTVDGRPVTRTNWSDHFRKVCAEVGLTGRTSTHDLRHVAACSLIAGGL